MYIFPQGGTDASIDIPLVDTNGAAVTGLVYNSAGATCYYRRPGGSPTAITLATLANAQAAHADGGFVEIDATNMEGLYRLDLPDAVIASGENFAVVSIHFDSTAVHHFLILLDPMPSVIAGAVVADAGNTASAFETDLSGYADNAFDDAFILFRTGALAGQVKPASDPGSYVASTQFVSVAEAFTATPADGDEFLVINR